MHNSHKKISLNDGFDIREILSIGLQLHMYDERDFAIMHTTLEIFRILIFVFLKNGLVKKVQCMIPRIGHESEEGVNRKNGRGYSLVLLAIVGQDEILESHLHLDPLFISQCGPDVVRLGVGCLVWLQDHLGAVVVHVQRPQDQDQTREGLERGNFNNSSNNYYRNILLITQTRQARPRPLLTWTTTHPDPNPTRPLPTQTTTNPDYCPPGPLPYRTTTHQVFFLSGLKPTKAVTHKDYPWQSLPTRATTQHYH